VTGRVAADVNSSMEPGNVVKALARGCDCVLADSAPLAVCGDAMLAGRWCDGAYMVCREDRFIGDREGHYAEDLRDCGVPLLGCILNASKEVKERRRRRW